MSLAEKLQQVQQLENKISRMVDKLKTQLATAVAGQHLEGVKEIGCGIRVVSVSLSARLSAENVERPSNKESEGGPWIIDSAFRVECL